MRPISLLSLVSLSTLGCHGLSFGGKPGKLLRGGRGGSDGGGPSKRALLQNVVTWDQHSLLINGERIMLFCGEFHPFRLPVPSLWLDILQKIRALGLNCASFYVDWALLEGKRGNFTAEGVFAWDPFFEAALKAGVYLIARPGPYINAETSGGGYPGWLQRTRGTLRTTHPEYLAATDNYVRNIAGIIAKAQITNGGPVILYQPENEYSSVSNALFLEAQYMQYVEDQARAAGIVVPLMNNDAYPAGNNAPGTGRGAVDIYGHDGYPLGFNCGNPTFWNPTSLSTRLRADHLWQSPMTPYAIPEYQGGSFDPWGGWGFEQCAALANHEYQRVFYKNVMAAGVSIFNIYMVYGGTNWGNLGHPGGYTSYDYGAAIMENGRTVTREKYSELKLEAQFLRVSPGYLTATPGLTWLGGFGAPYSIAITGLAANQTISNGTGGWYLVYRHADPTSMQSTTFRLTIPTYVGLVTVPRLRGRLVLNGRDSKFLVINYPVGNTTILYSTAEIFTWKQFEDRKVLVVYGGPSETHELAILSPFRGKTIEGSGITIITHLNTTTINFDTSPVRRVVQVGDLWIHLVDRNTAYNYWVPDLPGSGPMAAYGTSHLNPASVIIYGGYLVRSVAVDGDAFLVKADFNRSTTLELFGVPKAVTKLILNGAPLSYTLSPTLGSWVAEVPVPAMKLAVPDLKSLDWTMVDSLPEIQPGYDDSKWVDADHTTTNNTYGRLWTPVSLYGSDYGFNTGTLIFRGHFVVPAIVPIATAPSAASRPARRAAYTFRAETASGTVTEIPSSTTTAIPTSTGSSAVPPASTQPARTNCTLTLIVQGGYAFAFSIFLNATYIGSWAGTDAANAFNGYVPLQDLVVGESYVITAIVDTTGMDENWLIGSDMMKNPRGILDYALMCRVAGESPIAPTPTSSTPRPATDTNTNTSGNSTNNTASSSSLVVVPIRWKLTGNLGGEDYPDRARGPLNEGGFFAERNGLHLPGAPLADRRYGGRKGSPFGVDVSARNASHGGGWVRFYGATLRLDLPSDRFDIPVSFTFVNATDADPPQRLRPFRALLYVNGWQFGKYASNIGPQTDFPVPEGILNYNGDNWIGLVVWTLDGDRTGPVSLPGFHLSIRTPVLTGREKVTLVESPGWTERDGAY